MTSDTTVTAETRLLPGPLEQHLVSKVPVCGPDDRAADVRRSLVGRRYLTVDDIVVRDPEVEGRFLGLIPMARLLAARDDERAGHLMDPDPPVVSPGVDVEEAAWKAVQHGESTLAVVDDDGSFLGVVPDSRLMGALLGRHDQDFARIGGYVHSATQARRATEEPVGLRLWHRMPWLLLGLVGSAVSAWLVGGFEDDLSEDVRLAFFVPGVVYMADAVGTQTEALVIRGLSVGASMRHAFRLEVFTGALMGMLLALVTFPSVLLVLGSADLALAVAIALFAACAVATVVAMGLPLMMNLAGRDPAYGSGPLATVVQDLLSLVIYFAVAVALVR